MKFSHRVEQNYQTIKVTNDLPKARRHLKYQSRNINKCWIFLQKNNILQTHTLHSTIPTSNPINLCKNRLMSFALFCARHMLLKIVKPARTSLTMCLLKSIFQVLFIFYRLVNKIGNIPYIHILTKELTLK